MQRVFFVKQRLMRLRKRLLQLFQPRFLFLPAQAECLQLLHRRFDLLRQRLQRLLHGRGAFFQAVKPQQVQRNVQLAQRFGQLQVFASHLGLHSHRLQHSLQLLQQVLHAGQVFIAARKPALRFFLAGAGSG